MLQILKRPFSIESPVLIQETVRLRSADPRTSYGGLRSAPTKTRNFGPKSGRMKEYWKQQGPANLVVWERFDGARMVGFVDERLR